jgi:cell wall-associated NlpC family hydrolase
MTSRQVLKQARKWLGTQESPRNSNRTKIGARFGWNGVPWCAEFVSVVLNDAGAKIRKNASAPGLHTQLRGAGWKPVKNSQTRPGDIVFFTWPGTSRAIDHVGFIEGRHTDGRLITIEGNTTLTNGNGGVARKLRARNCVAAIVRPPYLKGRA